MSVGRKEREFVWSFEVLWRGPREERRHDSDGEAPRSTLFELNMRQAGTSLAPGHPPAARDSFGGKVHLSRPRSLTRRTRVQQSKVCALSE